MTVTDRSSASHRLSPSKAVLVLVLVIGLITSHPRSAHANQTWNVTPNSACTLANAITANNSGATSGSCSAGDSGTGTIDLAAGTYTLSANLPFITHALNIVGSGVSSTIIDGQSSYYVFNDTGSYLSGVSNLTVQNAGTNFGAGAGYAITAENSPTISNVVVNNSTGGGIYAYGQSVTITNTAIVHSTGNAYGLYVGMTGGAWNVTNTTIASNRYGIYIPATGGTVNLTNDTLANNGSIGINFDPQGGSPVVNLENDILDANGTNCDATGTTFTSQGHNISSDNSCGFVGTSSLNNTDPGLGSLALSNGTYVLPITYSSQAYTNATPVAGITTDQRGVSRPQCTYPDIGAYETTTCTPVSGGSGGTGGSGSSGSGANSSPKKSTSTSASTPTSTPTTPSTSTTSTTASTATPASTLNHSVSASSNKASASSKKVSSHTDIWISIVVILLLAIGGGWFYFSKNPKILAKLLSKITGNTMSHKAH